MALTVARKMQLGAALAFVVLLLGGFLSLYSTNRLLRTTYAVRHTNAVIQRLGQARELLVDVETGARGFALTGRPEFLEPLDAARNHVPAVLSELRQLTADRPSQQARLNQLDGLVRARMAGSDKVVVTRQTQGLQAAAELVATGRGKALMDRIRLVLQEMNAEEARLLNDQTMADAAAVRTIRRVQGAVLLSALVLVLLASLLLRRLITQPVQQMEAGVRRLAGGDLSARIATHARDEMGRLAQAFNQMAERRQEAEVALVSAKASLDTLIQASPAAVIAITGEGVVDVWNPAAERVFGWKAEEVLHRPLAFVHQGSEPGFEQLRDRVIGQRQVLLNLDRKRRRKDGTIFDARISLAPRIQDGQVQGMMALLEDVSEQKRAADAQRESEARLRRAQQIAHLGSWELDLVNNRITWSDEVYRIFGLQPQEFGATYEAFLDAIHPDDRDAVDDAYTSSLKEGRDTYEIEHRVVQRSTGEVRLVYERCEHFRDASGRIIRSVGTVHDITERKRAEEALRESEARYRRTLDDMLEGCMLIGRDWTYLYVNSAAAEHGQQRVENLIGRRMPDVYPGIEATDVFVTYRRCMEEGAAARIEAPYTFADGRTRWYIFSVQPAPEGIFVLSLDITEAKEAEVALRESETRYRDLFERASDGIFIANLEGHYTDVNAAGCRMLGYAREELVGMSIVELIRPEDAPRLEEARSFLLSSGRSRVSEWLIRRKDGTFIPIEVSESILPDGRWQGFTRDISVRKRMEQELRESEERFRLAMDEAPTGMALVSLDGQFMRVNNALCEIVGYSASEFTGLSFQRITPPGEVPEDLQNRSRVIRGEIPRYQREKHYIRKNGTLVDVLINVSVVRDRDGRPLHLIAQVEDITERRRFEDERQVFISLLENSSDFIGIADPTGRPIYVNPAGRKMVGLPPDYPVGETQIPEYYTPDQREFAANVIVKAMVEQGRWSGETWFRHWQTNAPIPVSDEHFMIREPRTGRVLGMGTVTRDISEAKRLAQERERLLALERQAREELEAANEHLRESEERFRLTIDEAPIGMALVNLEGRFVRVNHVLCEIVGYSSEELTSLTFQDITHPDDLDTDLALVGRLTLGEIPRYQLEKRYIRKNGSVVDIMLSGSVLRDPSGAPLYYIAQIEDITERKRAEEALRRSEAKFSGIISIAEDAIISVDEEQRITLYNSGAEKIFGYSRNEVLGRPLGLLLPERFRASHRRFVEGFRSEEATARHMKDSRPEIAGRRKNGEEFPAEASISRIAVSGETILTVALRDISERLRLERAQRVLAEAGALLISLDPFESVTAIARLVVRELAELCVVDLVAENEQLQRLTVVHADPANEELCERLARLPIDRGRPYLGSNAVEQRRTVVWNEMPPELMGDLAQTTERLQLLRQLKPDSGIAVPLLVHERFLGVLLLTSSQRGRYGPRDLPLAEELARRVALAIENARLFDEARRATRARDEMLGIVAHDLRSPLSAILLSSHVLRNQLASTGVRKGEQSVAAIQRSVQRAQRLILDLLDVTRLESGRLSVERHRLSARQVAFDAVEAEQLQASSASIELRLDIAEHLPEVWGDRDRLLQVMENLIGNALKFTPRGGSVTVGATPQGNEVLFRVSDTGSGIPTEHLSHVFDRFWQAKRADRQGAGLGLPICKGIVEAHGGRIWVESTTGQGTTFYFTVPVAHGAEEQPHEQPLLH